MVAEDWEGRDIFEMTLKQLRQLLSIPDALLSSLSPNIVLDIVASPHNTNQIRHLLLDVSESRLSEPDRWVTLKRAPLASSIGRGRSRAVLRTAAERAVTVLVSSDSVVEVNMRVSEVENLDSLISFLDSGVQLVQIVIGVELLGFCGQYRINEILIVESLVLGIRTHIKMRADVLRREDPVKERSNHVGSHFSDRTSTHCLVELGATHLYYNEIKQVVKDGSTSKRFDSTKSGMTDVTRDVIPWV